MFVPAPEKPLAHRFARYIAWKGGEALANTISAITGFHTPDELARLRTHAGTTADADAPSVRSALPAVAPDVLAGLESRLSAALEEIAKLRAAVNALENQVAELRKASNPGSV